MVPAMLYGVVLFMAAIAYYVLQLTIIRAQGPNSLLRKAIGRDWKGKLSPVLYLSAIIVTVWSAWIAQILYATVALIWFVPDKRIEHVLPREGA